LKIKKAYSRLQKLLLQKVRGGEVDEGVDECEPGKLITSPCDSV
jgi:hypothetical protein